MAVDDGSQEIREVNQQLKDEQQIQELKQSLPWFIGAAVAVIVIVAGRQYWDARQTRISENYSVAFDKAAALATTDKLAGLAAFDAIVEEGPDGYAAMAALQAASLAAEQGERDKAINYLLGVAENSDNPKRLKDLARVRAGYLSLADGRDRALLVLNGLEAEATPFGVHAKEIAGLAAFEVNDYQTALSHFEAIQAVPDAAERLRQRAKEFAALADLGIRGKTLELTEGASSEGLLELMDTVSTAIPDEAASTNKNETEQGATSDN